MRVLAGAPNAGQGNIERQGVVPQPGQQRLDPSWLGLSGRPIFYAAAQQSGVSTSKSYSASLLTALLK